MGFTAHENGRIVNGTVLLTTIAFLPGGTDFLPEGQKKPGDGISLSVPVVIIFRY